MASGKERTSHFGVGPNGNCCCSHSAHFLADVTTAKIVQISHQLHSSNLSKDKTFSIFTPETGIHPQENGLQHSCSLSSISIQIIIELLQITFQFTRKYLVDSNKTTVRLKCTCIKNFTVDNCLS